MSGAFPASDALYTEVIKVRHAGDVLKAARQRGRPPMLT